MVRCVWCGATPEDGNPITITLSGPSFLAECEYCLISHDYIAQSGGEGSQ